MSNCQICNGDTIVWNDAQFDFTYDYCKQCHFIKKSVVLEPSAEKEEYMRHNNTIENESYVNYFKGLIDSCFIKYCQNKTVLDMGSGPYPILKEILLRDYQITIDDYDLYFNPNEEVFKNKYDTIITTEVIEHVDQPLKFVESLLDLLNHGGHLVIMTLFHHQDQAIFDDWWYRRDPTHIGFFDLETFNHIAAKYDLKIVETDNKRLIVLQKWYLWK